MLRQLTLLSLSSLTCFYFRSKGNTHHCKTNTEQTQWMMTNKLNKQNGVEVKKPIYILRWTRNIFSPHPPPSLSLCWTLYSLFFSVYDIDVSTGNEDDVYMILYVHKYKVCHVKIILHTHDRYIINFFFLSSYILNHLFALTLPSYYLIVLCTDNILHSIKSCLLLPSCTLIIVSTQIIIFLTTV